MEHPGQDAEEQTQQEFPQSWGPSEPTNQRPLPPSDATGRRYATLPETPGPASPGLAEPAQPGGADPEALLSTLVEVSHTLAHAESGDILPLALRALLSLTGAARGLALACPAGPDRCYIAILHNLPEDLAEGFLSQSALLKASSGEVIQLAPRPAPKGKSAVNVPGAALKARLARVGLRWYLALPLRPQGQVEAVVVVVGQQEPASPAGSTLLSTAVTLLGELASAALEQAQLRRSLASEERARDEFIGLASHELKSPLTIIKGYAQLLLRQSKRSNGGAVNLNGLEAISQQVTRMSQIVGELLDVSRIERGTVEILPQQTDLVALAQRVVEQRQKTLTDVALHLVAREPTLTAFVDPARVEQVLGYLLDNAVKFGQEQGPVEVTVERSPARGVPPAAPSTLMASDAAIDAETLATSKVAVIAVRDYGLGLPVEERGNLFKAFYRGPENSPQRQLAGLGLGLYLSYHLVTRQGGQLWAEFPDAASLGGSLFRMSFPLRSPS